MKQKNKSNKNEILIYTTPTEKVKIEVLFRNETIWLTQSKIAQLFDTTKQNISYHLQNIYQDKELSKTSTVKEILTVQNEGNRKIERNIEYYNLDAIISVGYRVNSEKATQFRIWATQTLKDFIIKGFVLDDERLKNGENFGKDYFQELLERVRSIRASERRIYLKITDIFSECTIDYNPKSSITKDFFAMVQNKFHFAITGKTASEIVHNKADHKKKNMGLTTWKNSPKGRILQSDVIIAKNYLPEKQIKRLERTVSSFFDYIENIIENKQLIKMKDFAKSVDKFLAFNEFKILDNKGKISQKQAKNKALKEYKIFNKHQKIESDFEKQVIKKLKQIKK